MIEVRNHAAMLPRGLRDTYNVLGANAGQAQSAQARVEGARAQVARLTEEKAAADRLLKSAVAKNDGRSDLNALSRTVHRLASELAAAEEEAQATQCVVDAWAAESKRVRFEQIAKELSELRAKFAELYREAALALGKFYTLGSEARELAVALADRIPNGTRYYPPNLKSVLADADSAPNPLPELKDTGRYCGVQAFPDWRHQIFIEPLKEKK